MSPVRKNVLVALIACASIFVTFGAAANDAVGEAPRVLPASCTPPIKCCRVCTTGKACGASCIDASKTCKKGKGCACNAADVCAEDP